MIASSAHLSEVVAGLDFGKYLKKQDVIYVIDFLYFSGSCYSFIIAMVFV